MTNTKTKHAAIIPLIGGELLAAIDAHGTLPEYILTYTPFKGNDQHIVKYLKEKRGWQGPYLDINDEDDAEAIKNLPQVESVSTVCPCAGLSSLSGTASADSAVNDWLYESAEYVLGKIKPKVFWGENAYRLSSQSGKPVVEKMMEIGLKHGYSMTIVTTKSELHGSPQIRPRSFYMFTEGVDSTPVFPKMRREMKSIDEILSMPRIEGDPMDVVNTDLDQRDLMENPIVQYALHATNSKTLKEMHEKIDSTVNFISHQSSEIYPDGHLRDAIAWYEEHGYERQAKHFKRRQEKLDKGLGYWCHGLEMPKHKIGAYVGAKPGCLINPFTGTIASVRDGMRIMGLPDDFELVDPIKNQNHVCQNVPFLTARDIARGVEKHLHGELDTLPYPLIRQSNVNGTITIGQELVKHTVSEPTNTLPLDV